jgi:hypothetical protein
VVLGIFGETELLEDLLDMGLDGSLGDDKVLRDCFVGASLGHERQNLALAWGQLGERVVQAPPSPRPAFAGLSL